jgi:Bcr/CflA subfamily drug resistance transporter
MKNKSLLYLLALLIASLAQVMADLYLPILPAMEKALHTTPHAVQFSIAAYIWGYAISQLFYGPLSDAYGRKPILLLGLTIAAIGSWACFDAAHMNYLIMGRCLQGAGAGAGLAISRAVLRDLFHGPALIKAISYFAIANVIIMTSAPVVGALLQLWFGWHANFTFLLIYSIVIWLLVLCFLPETNRHRDPNKIQKSYLIQSVTMLYKDPKYIYYVFNVFCAYAAILVWVTMSSMLLIKHRHMVPLHYSFVMLGVGAVCAVASRLNPILINNFGARKIILIGALLMLSSGMLLVAFNQCQSIWCVIIPIYVMISGTSIVFPNSIASALSPFHKVSGTAAALLGFLQISGGAIASSIVSAYAMHTALAMGVFIVIISFFCVMLSKKIYK